MTAGYMIIGNGLLDISPTPLSPCSTATHRRNILAIFVSDVPLHKLSSCTHVFFGNCWTFPSLVVSCGTFSCVKTTLSFDGQLASPTPFTSSRLYLVSGTKSRIAMKLIAVKITVIHFCQRQERFVTIKPQTRGPIVLPPAMAFL